MAGRPVSSLNGPADGEHGSSRRKAKGQVMAARRVNPRAVKLHRSYSVPELAACFGVHKNTVRHWQRDGLKPIDGGRPLLFQGAVVRAFLSTRRLVLPQLRLDRVLRAFPSGVTLQRKRDSS